MGVMKKFRAPPYFRNLVCSIKKGNSVPFFLFYTLQFFVCKQSHDISGFVIRDTAI